MRHPFLATVGILPILPSFLFMSLLESAYKEPKEENYNCDHCFSTFVTGGRMQSNCFKLQQSTYNLDLSKKNPLFIVRRVR